MDGKKWYTSKTLWTNIAAGAAMIAQGLLDVWVLPAQYQAGALAVINFLLRFATTKPVTS